MYPRLTFITNVIVPWNARYVDCIRRLSVVCLEKYWGTEFSMESSSEEIHTRIFGALGKLCHALGHSCLGCSSLVILFYGICCVGTGNILDPQHNIPYPWLGVLQFPRWELLCPCFSTCPFPAIFLCFTATLRLMPELFSVCSRSEVCPYRRACLFICEQEEHTQGTVISGAISSWSAQLEWCLPG